MNSNILPAICPRLDAKTTLMPKVKLTVAGVYLYSICMIFGINDSNPVTRNQPEQADSSMHTYDGIFASLQTTWGISLKLVCPVGGLSFE